MGKFTEYELPIKSLSPGTHVFTFHPGKDFFANMESADIRDASLTVTVTVNYANDVYAMAFAVEGEVTVLCDRCLDEMQLPVDAQYHVTVKYGDAYRDDSDDVLEIPSGTKELNVAYMIYDTVALAIPIKHVHAPGKCNRQMSAVLKRHRAVTPQDVEDADLENRLIEEMDSADADTFGTETSESVTDPRWDALKGLANDTETDD